MIDLLGDIQIDIIDKNEIPEFVLNKYIKLYNSDIYERLNIVGRYRNYCSISL